MIKSEKHAIELQPHPRHAKRENPFDVAMGLEVWTRTSRLVEEDRVLLVSSRGHDESAWSSKKKAA